MLISPPFLPNRGTNEQEDAWIDAAMTGDQPGDGAYPVSFNLGWHGGLHLTAPTANNAPLPVRTIADGTVVYVRPPTAPSSDPNHALNYGGGWTSDGVVVIRHETAIGSGADAQLTFFSIYMHLAQVQGTVLVGQRIYRKAPIGTAGQIYGSTARKIHFEIICDDTNLRRLVGRTQGELNLTQNGRTDAVYGTIYVRLPVGATFYAQQPPANQTAPTTAAVHTTIEEFFVGLDYSGGRLTVTTYRADGTTVAPELGEADSEYTILTQTETIQNAYPAQGTRPIRSALYELLRYGRVVHQHTNLAPANVPHWRRVAHANGQGWVNLNAANTMKYSDADFPHFRGWVLVDDSTDQDSRCDSPTVRGWLDANQDGRILPDEATARLGEQSVASKLARTLCKFPTEWQSATIEARWGWLRMQTLENPTPLSAQDFERLRAHIQALCFWEQANLRTSEGPNAAPLPASHWRVNPREFIRWTRKCGWLSPHELAQCIPRTSLGGAVTWATALQCATNQGEAVNLFFRKYLGANRQRHIHALAQIYIETGLLSLVREGGLGNNHLYEAFYGRNMMQLTWPTNYDDYGRYKGIPNQIGSPTYQDHRITATSTHVWADPGHNGTPDYRRWAPRYDPDILITQAAQHRGESEGFYWVHKHFRGRSNINRVCDLGLQGHHVGFVSWLINGGGNGYANRQQYARYVSNVLLDEALRTGTEVWNYPPYSVNMVSTFPPTNTANTSTLHVNYTPQRP